MRTARIAFLVLLGIFAIGCGDKPKVSGENGGVTSGATEPTPDPVVPDNLKHAGYDYQGLENSDLMTYDVTFGELPTEEGTQQVTLEKVEGGIATYKVARTGGLSRLGVDTVELTVDGVNMVASSMGLLKEPSKLMLADATVGTKWETRLDMDNLQSGTQSVTSKIVNTVEGTKSVTVPAGTFDCLVVNTTLQSISTGSPNPSQNTTSTVKMSSYYAKGIGIVKLRGTDGSKQTVLVELRSRSTGEKSTDSASTAAKPAETKGE